MSTSYRGHTWGKIDFTETAIKMCTMDANPKTIFNVDYQSINNATVNKNDIILETGAKIEDQQDCMCQIRFCIDLPKEDNQIQDSEQSKSNQQKDGKNGAEDKQKTQKNRFTQNLYKKIIEKAKIGSFAGQSILTLNEVNLAVPRGKYTIDFYQKNLRFHGQTYNFVIDYKNIMKGFLLPMENQSQVSIILQLHKDKPIYQGQTLYRNIVIQIKKEIQVQVKTRVKDKDKQKNPNLVQIKDEYSGPLFQVLIDIIKSTARISLIAPDSKDFKSKNGQSCVKCGVKAQPGWLYFLKRSLIFIPKPVLYFKIQEIKKVQFNRLGATNKQFDMKITLIQQKKAVQFMGIQRNQLDILIEYFKSKNVKVEMEQDIKMKPDIAGEQIQDSQQDGDFDGQGIQSDDDQDQSFEEESLSGQQEKSKKPKKDIKSTDKKQQQNKQPKP